MTTNKYIRDIYFTHKPEIMDTYRYVHIRKSPNIIAFEETTQEKRLERYFSGFHDDWLQSFLCRSDWLQVYFCRDEMFVKTRVVMR